MVHERRRTRPGATMANFPGNGLDTPDSSSSQLISVRSRGRSTGPLEATRTTGAEIQDYADQAARAVGDHSWGELGRQGLYVSGTRRVACGPGNSLCDLLLDLCIVQPALAIWNKLPKFDHPDPGVKFVDADRTAGICLAKGDLATS